MTEEESDLIIAQQNKSTEKILKVVAKIKSDYYELCKLKDMRIAKLEGKISVLLSCKNCPKNKGGLICQKEYEDKCLAQKIQFIKELQEENVILKGRTEGFEKQILGLLYKYESVYKRFPDLKDAMNKVESILKENAELKEKLQRKEELLQRTEELLQRTEMLLTSAKITSYNEGVDKKALLKENKELKKACDETQELLDKQIEATYKLDKENAELRANYDQYKAVVEPEIRTLKGENATLRESLDYSSLTNTELASDLMKLKQENQGLKEELKNWKDEWQEQVQKANDESYARTLQTIQLNKAKEVITMLLNVFVYDRADDEMDAGHIDTKIKAEQFLSEVEK